MLGPRPGEVLGLSWDAVDLDVEPISIRQALKVERGTTVLIGPLKTAGSRRTLALPQPVTDALRAHWQRQQEERIAAGPNWVESGLFFVTSVGTPIDPRNFRRSITRMTERAGLGRWHPNELRHSAVSYHRLPASGRRTSPMSWAT
jgi:integrase